MTWYDMKCNTAQKKHRKFGVSRAGDERIELL